MKILPRVAKARDQEVFSREDTPTEQRVEAAFLYHVYVNSQKVEHDMLLTGKSVASRITHRRWTGGTALLSQRHGLLKEAEEESGHSALLLRFHLQSDAIPSYSADSTEQLAWIRNNN